MLNTIVTTIFTTMSIALLWSGPQNWAIVPFLVLMSVLFFKKKEKEPFWKPGEKLVNPLLCFYFVVSFIQALGASPDFSSLGFHGAGAIWMAVLIYKDIVIKPKREGK